MKTLIGFILAIAALLFSVFALVFSAKAQEHTFSDASTLQLVQLDDGSQKFITVDAHCQRVTIYNSDYTVLKTIDLPFGKQIKFVELSCVAQHLFNTDDNIEFAITVYGYYDVTNDYRYISWTYTGTGSGFFGFQHVEHMEPIEVNGAWKLKAVSNGSVQVYDLPNGYYPKQPEYTTYKAVE